MTSVVIFCMFCLSLLVAIVFFSLWMRDRQRRAAQQPLKQLDETMKRDFIEHADSAVEQEVVRVPISVPRRVVVCAPKYSMNCGGTRVLYEFARVFDSVPGWNAFVCDSSDTCDPNASYPHYVKPEKMDLNQDLVVYPEVVAGNPLKAQNVLRLVLCRPGIFTGKGVWKTWGVHDKVFFYSSFAPGIEIHSSRILYVVTEIPQKPAGRGRGRHRVSYMRRKEDHFHAPGSTETYYRQAFEIKPAEFVEMATHLKNSETFISGDPYTMWVIMAASWGVTSVVIPMAGVTKKKWVASTVLGEYIKHGFADDLANGEYGDVHARLKMSSVQIANNLPFGIAYGRHLSQKKWANATKGKLCNVFWDRMRRYGEASTREKFARHVSGTYDEFSSQYELLRQLDP